MYSKGIMWLDDCRIPFVDESDTWKGRIGGFQDEYVGGTCKKHNEDNTKGRFTPNLLVCDDMLNDGCITSKGKMKLHRMSGWGDTQEIKKDAVEYQGDKGTNSRYYDLDLWFDKMLEKL